MNRNPFRAAARFALLAAAIHAVPSQGQSLPKPPPSQDTQSPGGVSLKTGAFSHQERDLSIGSGSFPQALSLERNYLSSLDEVFAAYSGFKTQGWSSNLAARFSTSIVDNPLIEEPVGSETYLYSIVIGSRSVGFFGGSWNPTGGFVGTYEPAALGGESLVFTGQHTTGTFTFTDSDGTVLTFNQPATSLMLTSWLAPDGTRLDFSYGANIRTVVSNRGLAIIQELGPVAGGSAVVKACAVNAAAHYVTAASACPAGVPTVTYSYAPTSPGAPILTGATDTGGQTTSYAYDARGHLNCIRSPGQSACRISNTYGTCYRNPEELYDPPGMILHEPVRSQVTATGETFTYPFPASQQCPVFPLAPGQTAEAWMTTGSGAKTTLWVNSAGLPTSVTDPLNRTRTMSYLGAGNILNQETLLASAKSPEGNETVYAYDNRANNIEQRVKAKPGSGLADIVTTASYPSACANRKTCNRPDYVVDSRGHRTDYTYSPDHGGMLTETGPAVGGVRPQKRLSYEQRYAWIKNSGGGYSPAATPVWVLTQESFCRTSAATGDPASPCATAGDEVRTDYDYGPNSGPNNLFVRGQAVTADGQTLRTCFAYDAQGRKTSETRPRANLASCP